MTIIAMTREMEALGDAIAFELAQRLRLEIIDHELVKHNIAERLGAPETTVHRYLEGEASLLERWVVDGRRLFYYMAEEVLELAARGNVLIRSWVAAPLLRPIAHVIRVRVCAPLPLRVSRLVDRIGCRDVATARREIEHNDAVHASIMQHLFHVDCKDAELYDMVLSTQRMTTEQCVEQITRLAASAEFHETEAARALLRDKLVEARIRSALGDIFGVGLKHNGIHVSVEFGSVVLSGVRANQHVIEQAAGIVRGIEGVDHVEISNTRIPMRSYPSDLRAGLGTTSVLFDAVGPHD
jgi:cytidylate kinase